MKAIKFFSTFFICLGCITAFVGVAAIVLPMIRNDQLSLVLSSFQTPSQNVIVNAMNSAMTFALTNCFGVLFAGIGMLLVGVLLHLNAASQAAAASAARRWERAAAPRQPDAEAYAIPKWRSSKAAEVNQSNPFANAMAVAASGAPPRRIVEDKPATPPVSLNTFAPAVEGAAAPGRQQAIYAPPKPEQSDSPKTSPYARPVTVSTHEECFQPVYDEKPALAGIEPPPANVVDAATPVTPAADATTPVTVAPPPAPEPLKFVNPAAMPPVRQRKPSVVRSGFTPAAAMPSPSLATPMKVPAAAASIVTPPATPAASPLAAPVAPPPAVSAPPAAPVAMAAPTAVKPAKPAKPAKPRIKSTMGKHR